MQRLAAVGQVEEGFFHERTGATLPCQSRPSHLFCWDWATEHINRFGTPALQQFELVVISVVIGFAIAFAFALLAHRIKPLQWPLLAGTGVLFAIPSIAFFLLLLPITGRGRETAIIALSACTLQIIYRNVMQGLDNVPESAKDAAAGEQCRAFGGAAIMRMPGRIRITWSDDTTLKVETEAGTQTRSFAFGPVQAGEPSWQVHFSIGQAF